MGKIKLRRQKLILDENLCITRQRTKKDPITATCFLEGYELVMKAMPEGWAQLAEMFFDDTEGLGIFIEYRFIMPVLWNHLAFEKKPRGKSKQKDHLVIELLKHEASHIYVFLSYWLRKPKKEWPEYISKIIKKAESEGFAEYIKGGRKYNSLALTAYCLEKTRGHIPGMKKKLTDLENLYQTYIYEHMKILRKYFLSDSILQDKRYPLTDITLRGMLTELRVI